MTNPKMYKYKAFGLVIESEFFLPELEYGEGKADVSITRGSVPFAAGQGDLTGIISRSEFTFHIERLAKYSIQNGSRILVEPYENADLQTIKAYLLGTGIGVLIIQRGLIPVHGSAVVVEGKAVIFTGNCGAGKTTLCAWFQKCGYGYLADDISAIKMCNCHNPMVQPAFPQQKICADAAAQLDVDIGSLPRASLHDDKYIINTQSLFVDRQMPLQSVIEIREAENEHLTLRKIRGIEKVHHFMENIYCASLYKEIGFSQAFFDQCMRVIKQIDLYQLLRPKGIFTADEQMKLVVSKLIHF